MAGLFLNNLTPEQIANARKWIAALRSGEYEQGFGALCLTVLNGRKQWCCLGVGSDVVALEPSKKRAELLTEECEALGLRYGNGSRSPDSLVFLNDTTRAKFLQIADVIEQELALVMEMTA